MIKPDYAKWMLDDPRVNFAISTRGREPGLDHLGIQVESQDELHEVYARLRVRAARSSSKDKPPVATQIGKILDRTIRPAFRGKPSSPPARAPITVSTSRKARVSLAQPKPVSHGDGANDVSLIPFSASSRAPSATSRAVAASMPCCNRSKKASLPRPGGIGSRISTRIVPG